MMPPRPAADGRRRVMLFLLAGAANTLFGCAAFALLILLRLPPAAAAVGATAAGILFNFRTFGLVFRDRDPRRLPRFVGVYALLTLLNLAALHVLIGAGVAALAAEALVLPALAACSYLLMRRLVFAHLPPRGFRR